MRKMRLPPQLEGRHLHDHRQRLDDEHAADEHQHELLLGDQRHHAERRAERQRADVAHEHLRRIGVEPEEAEARGGQRAAEDRQLAGAGHVRDLQILGELRVAGDVGEDHVGAGGDHHRTDRQAVEPVGEVHGVRGADHDQRRERHVEPAEIGLTFLKNGMAMRRLEARNRDQREHRQRRHRELRREACSAPREPVELPAGDLR